MQGIRWLVALALTFAALAGGVDAAHAQGKGHGKGYKVKGDRAVSVTREVLVKQGYDVVRIERVGVTHVVYYRRGNMGKGKGKGPMEKMVIRTVEDRVVFEDAPSGVLVDIDVRLRL